MILSRFYYDGRYARWNICWLLGSGMEIDVFEGIKNLANAIKTLTLKHWKSLRMDFVVRWLVHDLMLVHGIRQDTIPISF